MNNYKNKIIFFLIGFLYLISGFLLENIYFDETKGDFFIPLSIVYIFIIQNQKKKSLSKLIYFGSIIFLVGLSISPYRFTLTSASLDMNLRQYLEIFIPTVKNSRTVHFSYRRVWAF